MSGRADQERPRRRGAVVFQRRSGVCLLLKPVQVSRHPQEACETSGPLHILVILRLGA